MNEVFVSPQGDDAASGSIDHPFATIERARKANASRVVLRGGVHQLHQTVRFGPEDGGMTFVAQPGETPIISGGVRITGWQRVQANRWHVQLPAVAAGTWRFRELYVEGRRRPRAALPKQGFYHIDKCIEPPPEAIGFNQFGYREGDLQPWHNLRDAEIVYYHKWRAPRVPIASLDEQSRIVTLAGHTPYKDSWARLEAGTRYRVQNVREAMTEPGEWYLDYTTGVLEYLAHDGEDPGKLHIVAPKLDTLIDIAGRMDYQPAHTTLPFTGYHEPVESIAFDGVTFAETNWQLPATGRHDPQSEVFMSAAVELDGAHHCRFDGCTFTRLGGYALSLGGACRRNAIVNNDMCDLGAGGVKLGETVVRNHEPHISAFNVIEHNHIHDAGITHHGAIGVWIGQSFDNAVRCNHIHDLYYTAVSAGWTWGYGPTNTRQLTIEYNHIHDIGRGLLSDMAGIYTLGVQPKTVIQHNHIHDVACYAPGEGGYGGWGIYTDEGSSYILIENNLTYRTTSGGFHQHYGRENIVRNNIFAFGKQSQVAVTRREPHQSITFERNIVVCDEGDMFGYDGKSWADDRIESRNNLYWHACKSMERLMGARQANGYDAGSIVADPKFAAGERGDFRLSDDSPALALGFKAFSVST